MIIDQIIPKEALAGLQELPDESVHCCITSPPYYGLRDYNHDQQLGQEETPELFIEKLVAIFREVKRVLRNDGTLWVNIADSWATGARNRTYDQACRSTQISGGKTTQAQSLKQINKITGDLKPKDLIGIPWLLAFALRSDGWYLRQEIIWSKPNPMPESVKDRCTKSHESIFLLSKSKKYYFDADAIKKPVADATVRRMLQDIEKQKGSDRVPGKNKPMKAVGGGHKNLQRDGKTHSFHESRKGAGIDDTAGLNGSGLKGHSGHFKPDGSLIGDGMANKKSVWSVATKPFAENHFATFPQELIIDPIKAGSPEGGIILDPFMGAGTTAIVAKKLNRHYLGFEINPEYVKIANSRLGKEIGLFL